ncbi:hypothetical protein [Actinomadura sp. 9N407]|uniref:hypothetical protein n=1 Tax=Actinomadura sp. 9N407 TaxID=3375154 RepID=UPI0037A19155
MLELAIRTDHGWQRPYQLDKHIVIVHGPVDRGKTSFLDSIAFVFGRTVRFRGTVHKHLREVKATVRIGTSTYVLNRRHLRRSHITVTAADGTLVGKFPVRRSENQQTFSDWLLEEFGLDEAIASISAPGGQQLDFASAILPYCYLCQSDIDRFLIMPPGQDTVRVAIMRLLFHLTSPAIQRLEGQIRDGERELRRHRDRLQIIEEFLGAPQDRVQQQIEMDIAALTSARQQAASVLSELQANAGAAERLDHTLAEQIRMAHREWREAETALESARRHHDRAQQEVNGFQSALEELQELQRRPPSPLTLHKVLANCPICFGPVPRQPPAPGRCYLCNGLHPGVVQEVEVDAIRQKLQVAQRTLEDLESVVTEAGDRANKAALKVSGLRHEREMTTGPDVHPHIGAIRSAAAKHARLTAELTAKRNDLGRIKPLTQLRQLITELQSEQDRRQAELEHLRDEHARPDNLLRHLRATLRSILDRIKLPHFTGQVHIDRNTLLPLIDGLDFDGRGGGARSAVSIAYSLALLAITQEGTSSLLPTLLMIDSPRKNFGAGDADTDLADHIYNRVLDYVITWSQSSYGARYNSFQIIIADNDRALRNHKRTIPKRETPYLTYIDLTQGLITGLLDPHAGLGKIDEPLIEEREFNEPIGDETLRGPTESIPHSPAGQPTKDISDGSRPHIDQPGDFPDAEGRLF